MSNQSNIKWRLEDERELRRVVKNFNAKLTRLVKKNPENKNILPQFWDENTQDFESKITIATLKEVITTRRDYNKYLNMLKRFSKPGAETIIDAPGNTYGSKTTKWQLQESIRLKNAVNVRRKERLERLNLVEMANASGKLGYTVGQMIGMGLASTHKLSPTSAYTPGQSQTDIKYKFRALFTEGRSSYHKDRDQILKNNYIRTLGQNYRASDITDVVDAIRKMDNNLFILKFEAHGDSFEFAYPPDEITYKLWLSELKGYWLKDSTPLDLSTALTSTIVNL